MAYEIPPDAPRPRMCLVKKAFPEEEYGFNLHAEKGKGQFIGKVDSDSPSSRAGLRQGDRIFAVNDQMIDQHSHKTVVSWIKSDPLQTKLFVIDEAGLNWYLENSIPINLELPNIQYGLDGEDGGSSSPDARVNGAFRDSRNYQPEHIHETHYQDVDDLPPPPPPDYDVAAPEVGYDEPQLVLPPPSSSFHRSDKPMARLCLLKKRSNADEYGFNLHAESGKGHFIGKVDTGSLADVAGLVQGQRIVGVNGTLIYPNSVHGEVISLIKLNPMQTELLVAFPAIDTWYAENNENFDFSYAERFPLEVVNGSIGEPESDRSPEPAGVDSFIDSNLSHGNSSPVKSYEEAQDSGRQDSPPAYQRSPVPNGAEDHNGYHGTHQEGSPLLDQQDTRFEDIFNMSAAEVRERLSRRQKHDPRKLDMSLQQKYDIARNL